MLAVRSMHMFSALPPKQGLYDPQFEHDACGVGFVVDIAGRKSNDIVRRSLQVLVNLQHRGAKGCDARPIARVGFATFCTAARKVAKPTRAMGRASFCKFPMSS